MTDTRTPNNNTRKISWLLVTLGALLFVLGIVGFAGHMPQSQQSPKPNEARDPDTIYQYGHPVGKVVAPEAHLAEGYWTFSRIMASRIMADGTFDGSSDFEYHDQRLKILSAESAGRIGSVGQTQQQNFANVRATVVGRR